MNDHGDSETVCDSVKGTPPSVVFTPIVIERSGV
jgi:hypothetical protein